ncbi:hypothetical protein V6N12_047169 [Hibiscus sabdariffa]|uniref:Uncharacterized protein n=1 Tax=Hibiscus sabdariffa TaxID=183260 RepID=A0ABR2DA37_9ROSI
MDSGTMEGVELNGGVKASYTAMTTKSLSTDGSPRKDFGFKDKELVLLDEDCLVDESGAFSMFKFLDIVHD